MIVKTLSLIAFRNLIWLCLASSVLVAQPGGYTIFGTVQLPDGSPAVRVTVSLSGQSGLSRQAFTDDMGRYQISELPRGRYSVSAANQEAPNQSTDPATVDTGRGFQTSIFVNLYFRERSDETSVTVTSPVVSAKEAAQKIPKAAQKAFNDGVKAGAGQKLDKAVAALSRAIQLYPGYFQAFAERGHVRLAMSRSAEAGEDFARALELNQLYGPALRGSGICKFEQGHYAEAITDLESATSVEPNLGKNFLLLGVAYLSTNRTEPARGALSRAVALDPKGSARARIHLATLAIQQHQPQEAISQLDAYLADAPDAADADKVRELRKQLQEGGKR